MTQAAPNIHAPGKEFIVLMASLMAMAAISIDAILPALGVISHDLQIANRNHAQYLIGGIFAGMAAGQLLAGPLSDAFGRKKILYVGFCIYLIGSIVGYTAGTMQVLLIGRVIQGLGVAGPYISAISIVRDRYAGRQMAKLMSIVMMIFMVVPAVAPSIGQAVMSLSSWRGIFVLYFIYAVTICVWIVFRLEETLPRERRIPFHARNIIEGFRQVVATRTSMFYMMCSGICFGSLIGYLNSSQQIFQDQFGTGEMFSIYFGALAVVVAASSMMNSRIVEKLGMRYIAFRAFLCIISSSAAFLLLHGFVEIELWMFLIYAAAMFFSFGLIFGNLNALAMEPLGHIAGIASAVIGSVSSLISMTIGAVIGQLYNGTLIPMTSGFLMLGILAVVMMTLAERARAKASA
ncbi:MAG: multidrug effflux MFS transporter [Micavibrio sp.]